jgi:peptide/nickel transport system substrate-binding protein
MALSSAGSIDGGASVVSAKIFDRLFNADRQGDPIPMLATSAETSPDGDLVTVRLRRGVTWHDGSPLTASDVAFSIEEVWKVHNARAQLAFSDLERIDTPDDHTVLLRFARPAPYILSAFADGNCQVVPRRLYAGTDILTNPANLKPIGSGPWIFESWRRGDNLVLKRNQHYWAPSSGGFEQLIFRFIASGAPTVAALETGDVDYASAGLPLSELARLQANPNVWVRTLAAAHIPSFLGFAFNLDRPALRDPRLRQAFAHAIDKAFMARNIWLGHARIADSPIAPDSPWHAPSLPNYDYDLAKAEALFDAAGLRRGADGVRIRLGNEVMPPSPLHLRAAQFIKQDLAKVGVELELRNEGLPAYLKRIFTTRDWDTETYSTGSDPDPAIGIQRFYSSKSIQIGVPFSNPTHYSTPALDDLLEQAKTEIDIAARRQLYFEVQQRVQADLPLIPILFPDTFDAGSKYVQVPDLTRVQNFAEARPASA